MKSFPMVLLGLALAVPVSAWAQSSSSGSLVVVANRAVPVEKIDPSQATQIFLKQVQTWPDGKPIQPIDIKEGAPLRMEFYSKITGRSPGQLRSYWARQAFTGMGFPPREVATAADVNKVVQTTPGAIGYLDRKNADAGVKVLLDPTNPTP